MSMHIEYNMKRKKMQTSEPCDEDIAGADILCMYTTPEEAEAFYLDIDSELTQGRLKAVYESVPVLYWDRVNVNGAIYNMLASPPAAQVLMTDNTQETPVPEELLGQPLTQWQSYLESVFAEKGTAFLYSAAGISSECPVSAGNGWNARFQLILPFLGIDPEEPEKGVQCIYESDYGQQMQELWCQLYEKGYIVTEGENGWTCASGYDVSLIEEENSLQYSLQSTTYAYPQVAGVRYYHAGISKTCEQIDVVCELLSAMSEDDALHEAMVRQEDGSIWFHLIPQSLLVENNGKSFYKGTLEENREKQKSRFEAAQEAPVPGFVFDTEPVQEEVDAVMSVISSNSLISYVITAEGSREIPEYASSIHYVPQEIIDRMYEQGLQTIIDEAERQIAAYEQSAQLGGK